MMLFQPLRDSKKVSPTESIFEITPLELQSELFCELHKTIG